ncbi:unnamed protein product, partial [Ixodes pacificus]
EAGPEERKCIFKDVDDCSFSFVYYYDENNEPEMNPIFKEPVSEYRNPMYETGQPSTAGLSSSRS